MCFPFNTEKYWVLNYNDLVPQKISTIISLFRTLLEKNLLNKCLSDRLSDNNQLLLVTFLCFHEFPRSTNRWSNVENAIDNHKKSVTWISSTISSISLLGLHANIFCITSNLGQSIFWYDTVLLPSWKGIILFRCEGFMIYCPSFRGVSIQ